MGCSITQVWIGRRRVGISGLEDAFREVRALDPTDDLTITTEIMARIRQTDYIPANGMIVSVWD